MALRTAEDPGERDPFHAAGKTGFPQHRVSGFLLGLLVALATAAIASGALNLTPDSARGLTLPTASAAVLTGTTPTEAIAMLAATATPSPSRTEDAQPPAARTSSPSPTPRPSRSTTSVPPSHSPTPTPIPTDHSAEVIGYSVQGRPIAAYRLGEGPIKVVLIGDIHGEVEANTYLLAEQLLKHFQGYPNQVPSEVSLWIIPTMNPDGLAMGQRWNASQVDLNRNADTDLDGCAGNDWSSDTVGLEGSHPGAGGPYPFSEPETRAVRDFLDDAWVAVFYHSAAEAIFADTCQRHAPSMRLAEVLSDGTGYPVPEEGWVGYPITGEFSDYLAGEGVAAVTVELADHEDPEFERNLKGVQALLASVDEILQAEANGPGVDYVWLDGQDTGVWEYAENLFRHPVALEVLGDQAYLLDGGRVLTVDLEVPAAPEVILAPGDQVEGVRVLEPLDLAPGDGSLLALDRAGDVYRYDPAAGSWALERYDRPPRDSSDRYYVALAGDGKSNYLLETTHEQVWRFTSGEMGAAWAKLPGNRDVDVSASRDRVYVLTRAMNSPRASLARYREGQPVSEFQPQVDLMHPRQVVATDAAVYVLDRAGRRLVALDPKRGTLLAFYQFRDRQEVSAMWADPTGERLILAGSDALYFYGEPERQATIEGGPVLDGPQPHDLELLESLRGLAVPIEGATVTNRDFQMPGAPRHYRLGVHEGMDFYGSTVGVPVDRRTPVHAVADGVVIRAMVDYQPLTAAQANAWDAEARSLGYTPPDVLDGYRGMQVWIDHGHGVVSRYAHLGSIQPGIVEGVRVTQGQVIGMVGNSGTPASVSSQTIEVHLHLELWVGDHYVGQFLRPIEAREWLEKILR
jgi:murein DD-endopeptidase MepM/ murein hydrolase activator NlpD